MNKRNILFLFSILTTFFTSAQDITGLWKGTLSLPNGSLSIIFHLAHSGNEYISTLDSPDQGVRGIKTQKTQLKDSTLTIAIPDINASYKGFFRKDGKIYGTFTQGLNFKLDLEKTTTSLLKKTQEPTPPFPYKTEEVYIKSPENDPILAGTLSIPQIGKNFTAVVMITGSGPQTRDEEMPGGHKPFLVIADYLTRHGIAVLRCDDRGIGKSTGSFAKATNEDFTEDALAAFNYLKIRKEIDPDKIGFIGHSCGGTIAFMAAARQNDVAFIISLAGAALKGDSLMLKQAEAICKSEGMTDSMWQTVKPLIRKRYAILTQDKNAEQIKKELRADVMTQEENKTPTVTSKVENSIATMTSPWYLHFMRYDPTSDLQKVKCPVLALNGDRDIQVDADMNLMAIKQQITSNKNKLVTIKKYSGLNHLFQTCKLGTLSEYGDLNETVNPTVLRDINEWIHSIK